MPKRSKGTDETQPGDVVYTHDDMVKFRVKYPKGYDPKKQHMKDGETYTIHEKLAKTLMEKGVGEITEYLNDKRDKSLDKENKKGELKVPASPGASTVTNGDKKDAAK